MIWRYRQLCQAGQLIPAAAGATSIAASPVDGRGSTTIGNYLLDVTVSDVVVSQIRRS
jgi:hypothetical protein